MIYKNTKEFALQLDANDELQHYRGEFNIPLQKKGEAHIYLCGNSLGLQATRTTEFINQELEDWATFGVEGHFHAKNPWMPYHEFLTESYSKIVGAKQSEVVAMNTLTVNLHLMMVSFYNPTEERYKIIIEGDAFPSDIYAVESQIKHHGYSVDDSLIKQLGYRLPFLIKELILKLDPPRNKFKKVIDLGCGTGLTGKELRDISNNLTGIDISRNMVAKTRELDLYDRLIVGDIVDILNSSKEKYDLFIALDVFIYIGELTKMFKAVRQCCNKNALFIFSIETQEEDGYSLLKSARYSHSDDYILKTTSDAFKVIDTQEVNLRKDKEGWIEGKIFILQVS